MDVPVLQTKRSILRGHKASDFKEFAALWSDPAVARFISGKPASRQESWMRLLRNIGHWQAMGYGYWAVESIETGRFLGEVGFANYMRECQPPLTSPEIGWVFARNQHGKGYASEAVAAALNWAGQNLESDRCCCIIDPAHQASIHLAAKCGFQKSGVVELSGSEVQVFERLQQRQPLG